MPTIVPDFRVKLSGNPAIDIDHGFHECDETVAWCGLDISGAPYEDGYLDDAAFPCAVCMDIWVCPKCGEGL